VRRAITGMAAVAIVAAVVAVVAVAAGCSSPPPARTTSPGATSGTSRPRATSSPASLPRVIADCTAPPPLGQRASLKPTSITVACADNGIGVEKLSWTSWTSSFATGQGTVWENGCQPNCAMGKIGYYPATVTLSAVRQTTSGPLFSRLTAAYQRSGPSGHKVDHFVLPLPPE
jgi:hypothetical protein